MCHSFYCLFYEIEKCGLLAPTSETDLFCLHYVFLRGINLQLDIFSESWNNHTPHTEGLNPVPLWTRGMCMATPSVTEQPMDDFGTENKVILTLSPCDAPEACLLGAHIGEVGNISLAIQHKNKC